MSNNNPAAAQGWVKSVDPKTGRAFYANHITRKTQWDAPAGWVEDETERNNNNNKKVLMEQDDDDSSPLPSNWEMLHDPTTGKPFYVDHERKITTWTRPTLQESNKDTSSAAASVSLRPAIPSPPSSGRYGVTSSSSPYMQSSTAFHDFMNSYASSHHNHHHSSPDDHGVDWSDSLQKYDFTVHTVPDALRQACPHCNTTFSTLSRRHHCRLCGDVVCANCSAQRVELPLANMEGAVRVCAPCYEDVSQGNYFGWHRYLVALELYEPNSMKDTNEDTVTSPKHVNAALSSMTADLQTMMTSTLQDTIAIDKQVLVELVGKHLQQEETIDWTLRCLATLLTLEAMVGGNAWKLAVYQYIVRKPIQLFLRLTETLERRGSDRKTLFVQEQAAKILFYLTEPQVMRVASNSISVDSTDDDDDDNSSLHPVELLDLHRIMPILLDHASSGCKNVNLQRWTAASLKQLILEDERRACMAINEMAAMIASGQEPPESLSYASFVQDLISTGGIMILTTLIATEDSDTRAHAVGALGAMLASTRAVHASLVALAEMTGGAFGSNNASKEGMMVRAIVAGGGCDAAVSQLLLSAEHGVASMGCLFLSALVMPLLSDPQASQTLSYMYDYRQDDTAMGACREASIEIVTGTCLPALLGLIRNNGNGQNARPIELRKLAMETLAAVVMSIGNMGCAWAQGQYEEGLDRSKAPGKLKDAILMLNEEGVILACLEVLQSAAGQSLGTDRETPTSRINECAGIVLGSLTSCSAEAIMDLQNRNILSTLLIASNDTGMPVPSTLRGDAAPRCLGILETVAAVLIFAWQHPSGASSGLLDQLIELMDAGVIPYLSKVINSKIDWESRDKSVGAMKARTASCRLLCCLFGVALTDSTGIGMRRLMEAVDVDARSYRGGDRAPSNVIESTLSVLQKALAHARASLLGTLNQGPHYHAAVMDLADAALLAVGSMCGSSVAPGGSEGSMVVTGESFLAARDDDFYAERRKSICKVACEIIVRGGRGGPAILPTMLVGGFGETTVLSSLRLALAIAQNGSKEEHAKLASSGLLVPISDSLRAALSSGDLYRFSASLAMVRFCGPHVATGSSGGVQSVRDAIRIATNVLTLPINPEATIKQLETQDSLKSECIAALESLSHNASLWSSISSEALPAIAQYLHSTALMKSGSTQRQNTRCAALKAVLQIVQVPSHAVSAAQAGIVEPLCKLLRVGDLHGDDVQMLALEVLHVISKNPNARAKANFLGSGLLKAVCAAIGKSATFSPSKPSDSRADVMFLGLEMLFSMLSDIEKGLDTSLLLSSKGAMDVVDAAVSEPLFVRALCSTLLLKTNMQLPRHDGDNTGEEVFELSKLYGPPLIQVHERCAGYEGTHEAAAGFLFTVSAFACALDTNKSELFWNTVLLQDLPSTTDSKEATRLSATFCAHYLALLTVDYKPFLPLESNKRNDFTAITRPLVLYRLLSSLKDSLASMSEQPTYDNESRDPFFISLVIAFNVPHLCLSLWKDPVMLDLAFLLMKQIVELEPDEVLHLFVDEPPSIQALFDLLSLDPAAIPTENVGEMRRFLASVLARLADSGLLVDAIGKFDMRSKAIEALASACMSEEIRPSDEDEEDMASARLSTTLMKCLVDLCTVKKRIQLTPTEAQAIARNLGKKICFMVISRFLERAKLQEYEIDEDDDIMAAPDVAMLCAVAQHDDALSTLRALGGLHALSLVAAEGELSAMLALQKACDGDVSIILEGETHVAMITLLTDDRDTALPPELEGTAFALLARLCSQSSTGRKAVIELESCRDCVHRALTVISLDNASPVADVTDDEESESGDNPADEDKKEDDDSAPSPPAYSFIDKALSTESVSQGSIDLIIAACFFLAALVSTTVGKTDILHDDRCLRALSSLIASESPVLSFAALSTLVSMAPFATKNGSMTVEVLSDVFLSVLKSTKKITASIDLNTNKYLYTALSGVNVIFETLQHDRQKELADAASKLFQKGVKLCVVTRASTKETEMAFSAELSFNLSITLQLAHGKDGLKNLFTQELLTSFVHLTQWRHDPKTSVGSTNTKYWDACIANCLSMLALAVWQPEEVLMSSSIKLETLSETSLMLARPGKAPRKAIDFLSVLNRLVSGQDALASVSAQRILDRLF